MTIDVINPNTGQSLYTKLFWTMLFNILHMKKKLYTWIIDGETIYILWQVDDFVVAASNTSISDKFFTMFD